MRVTGGRVKGRKLRAVRRGGRPTSGLVRGVLFSMLEARGLDYSRVLDLYAGTGALGIEALSRQAQWVDFVEQSARNYSVIQQNLKALGLRARVYCTKVERAISFLAGPYDLVLIDPPYAQTGLLSLLERLGSSPLVSSQTTVAVTHSSRHELPARCGPLYQIQSRRHGDTTVALYRWQGGAE